MGKSHRVQQGEDVPSLAARFGLGRWQTIWDDPNNADLKKLRENPSLLLPGDRIYIPDPVAATANVSTGGKHQFKRKKEGLKLCLVMKDREGEPIAGRPYQIYLDDEVFAEGETDSTGKIEKDLRVETEQLMLHFYPDADLPELAFKWRLKMGVLDPVDEIQGVQGRLNNLGFLCGRADGRIKERTRSALQAFQKSVDLEESGEIDDATCEKLLAAHDQE
jgi:hypothetical protein